MIDIFDPENIDRLSDGDWLYHDKCREGDLVMLLHPILGRWVTGRVFEITYTMSRFDCDTEQEYAETEYPDDGMVSWIELRNGAYDGEEEWRYYEPYNFQITVQVVSMNPDVLKHGNAYTVKSDKLFPMPQPDPRQMEFAF